VVVPDWPAFGAMDKPAVAWTPDLLSDYLEFVLGKLAPRPHAVIAAGHAATYAYDYFAGHPGEAQRLVSLAPTWRGPLPTMMNGRKRWFDRAVAAFDTPVAGDLLYAINLSRPVIRWMARRHVYSDPEWLGVEGLAAKLAVARAKGARHGSVRFVTGALDRVASRSAFLDLAASVGMPHLLVYGEGIPPRSKAEMAELAKLTGVETAVFPRGKLSLYEEFAPEVAKIVLGFLAPQTQPSERRIAARAS
jgi:pimeloyl-ACP methyl ester carboxylesterase